MTTPLLNGLGGPSGFGEAFLARNDDTYTDHIDLRSVFPGGLNFYGTVYTGLYINNNGSVTFATGISQYTPTSITGNTSNPIIAPYWADIDTRVDSQAATDVRAGTVAPTPGGTSTGSDTVWYDLDSAAHALTVTWDDVGYYAAHADKLNAFQLRLVAVPVNGAYTGDFNIEFRYEAITWVAGDASGGTSGLGGTAARIGYSSGNGTAYVELPQSGDQAALLDIPNASNIGVPGTYQFDIRNGAATPAISIGNVTVTEGNAPGQTYAAVPVTLAAQSFVPITVGYATVAGTAADGADYTGQRGTVTFAPGTLRQTILIPIVSDQSAEPTESFTVHLGDAAGAPIAGADGTVTILDDDGLTVADASALEGAGTLVFTVSLLSPAAQAVSVRYALLPGTAVAGTDYTDVAGTLAFAPGETSKTVAIPITDDGFLEPDETFQFRLADPVGATIARGTATGTILNDDGLVIDDLSVSEGAAAANVTVRLLGPVATAVSATYSTAPGTATPGLDYAAATGTVTIPAGSTSVTIPIPIIADSAVEPGETFTVTLSGAAVSRATATVTIIDDDGFSVTDVTVVEGSGGASSAVFTVTLRSAIPTVATVAYGTSGGTATSGLDFTATSGTLTFAPGITSQTVAVPIATDAVPEQDETLFLILSNPSANTGIVRGTGQATIVNDDGLSIGDATVTEGNAGTLAVALPVTLGSAAAQPVTVGWATSDGTATAGSDYLAASGTLTFAPGETAKTITVLIAGDTVYEPNETFRVVLSNPSNFALVKASGTVVITNDDDDRPPPALTISPAAVTEGAAGDSKTIGVVVSLSYAAMTDVTVRYATSDATATSGSDYVATAGTLTIPAGSLSGIVAVRILGDATIEPDESLIVTLSAPSANATIAAGVATVTILNDDSSFSIAAPAARFEGNAGVTPFTFTVTRAGYAGDAQSVTVTPSGAGGSPVDAADLVGGFAPAVVAFAPGETQKTVGFGVQGDTTVEADETLAATLSGPSANAAIATAAATVTVLNDDSSFSIAAPAARFEGNAGATAVAFTVSRAGYAGDARSITVTPSGAGSSPVDAAELVGGFAPLVLSFASGETLKAAVFSVQGDTEVERDETIRATLSAATPGSTIETGFADSLILNDDASFSIAAPAARFEGNAGITAFAFVVSRAGYAGDAQSIVVTPSGTGSSPIDATDLAGGLAPVLVTFAPGETQRTVEFGVQGDTTIELDETLTATLSSPPISATIATAAATVTILNDDSSFSIAGPAARPEGNAGITPFVFKLTRAGYVGAAQSVTVTPSGAGGNPVDEADFVGGLAPVVVAFSPGETQKTIEFGVRGDTTVEPDEILRVTLSSPTGGATTATRAADTTVLNDDYPPEPVPPNFDPDFYLAIYPDLRAAFGTDAGAAVRHYMSTGWREGRDPSAAFSTGTYLTQNPDVRAAGVNPLSHFNQIGWREGRNPNALFDVKYYLTLNPDVRAAGVNPLAHFEANGWREGREPSLAFSARAYLAANPDVRAAGINAFDHYLVNGQYEGRPAILNGPARDGADATRLVDEAFAIGQVASIRPPGLDVAKWFHQTGWTLGVNPNAWFDTSYYLTRNPDVRAAGIDPLAHFEAVGWSEGREPSLLFSDARYLATYPDVRAAGLDPLLHYIANGRAEGRMAFLTGGTATADPLVDAAAYARQIGATLLPTGGDAAQQAAFLYDAGGWQRGLNPGPFFDTSYYLSHNPDVAAAQFNPLTHYENFGWLEGRDPSAQFSTRQYLAAYGDVKAAGLNPLLHYAVNGQAEGRTAFPA